MKADYTKFPDLPLGCSLNYNEKTDSYQVYREQRVNGVIVRESVGSIKNNVFKKSKLFEASEKIHALRVENENLKAQLANQEATNQEIRENISRVIHEKVEAHALDSRQQTKIVYPLSPIMLGALACALSGQTDCVFIANFINNHLASFAKTDPGMELRAVTHDVVYRALMKIDPEHFQAFYQSVLAPMLIRTDGLRILAGDGQAVRATGLTSEDKPELHGARMTMNFYDVQSRACVAYALINEKTNEITAGPELLEKMDLRESVVTADAMSCQMGFVDLVMRKGGDYCLSLKGNQDKSFEEVKFLFHSKSTSEPIVWRSDVELEHGRIETRTVRILPGAGLSLPILAKWKGLANGSIVQVIRESMKKSTRKNSTDESFYITSLPPEPTGAADIARIIRSHWAVENNLHWMLDVHFLRDRTQAKSPYYIANRVALNKMALAMIENYRYWLWDKGRTREVLSINATMHRCQSLEHAFECISCSQGLL